LKEATRIIAIRHGQTAWNAEMRMQGQLDTALDARGRWQARQLAQALAHEPIGAIVASDLSRAMQTAAPLAAARGLRVQPERGRAGGGARAARRAHQFRVPRRF